MKEPTGKNNLAYKLGEIAMTCTADDTEKFKPRRTVTSRYLGLIWTALFDAWSRYDAKANPVYLKNVKRRPVFEHSLKNKEIVISYDGPKSVQQAGHWFIFSEAVSIRDHHTLDEDVKMYLLVALRLFTGSDYFGEQVQSVPGALTEPKNLGDTVTLKFPTFTETADMEGVSRVIGGYHIQSDNIEGLKLGHRVGNVVWKKYLVYANGDQSQTRLK